MPEPSSVNSVNTPPGSGEGSGLARLRALRAGRPLPDRVEEAPVEPSPLSPFARLKHDGYLLVESSVVGGRVLWIADPSRVPAELRHLPAFGWDEIGHLLTLPREAARQAIRDLLAVKRTLGSGSRIAALTEDHGGPEEAPGPGVLPTPSPASEKPASPPPPETADLFGEARP